MLRFGLINFLVAASLIDQATIERPAGTTFIVVAYHPNADIIAGGAGEGPIDHAVIGVMFRTRSAIRHTENIAGFDHAGVAAQIGGSGAVG